VHDTFRDTFAIEVRELFKKMNIVEGQRATGASAILLLSSATGAPADVVRILWAI